MADLVLSGEVPLSPTIFRDHALEMKAKGGPIDWAPMDVVPTNAGGVSIIAQAPHAHAAVLLTDFLLGRSGEDHGRSGIWQCLQIGALTSFGIRKLVCPPPVRQSR
jgi:ABC-type Fe3+ transport system substrate-binding protein